MDDTNPYSPPNKSLYDITTPRQNMNFVRGNRKGPTIYVAMGALIFGFASPQYLMQYNPIGFVFPFVGSIAGAIIYRFRSKQWPIDPAVSRRVLIPAIIYIVISTAAIFALVANGRTQAAGIIVICLLVGTSVATGMIVSGGRRHGEHQPKT